MNFKCIVISCLSDAPLLPICAYDLIPIQNSSVIIRPHFTSIHFNVIYIFTFVVCGSKTVFWVVDCWPKTFCPLQNCSLFDDGGAKS